PGGVDFADGPEALALARSLLTLFRWVGTNTPNPVADRSHTASTAREHARRLPDEASGTNIGVRGAIDRRRVHHRHHSLGVRSHPAPCGCGKGLGCDSSANPEGRGAACATGAGAGYRHDYGCARISDE